MHARIDSGDIVSAARLDENGFAEVAQFFHERQDVPLQEWFASGDFDKRTLKSQDTGNDLRQSHFRASVECVGRITVGATEVAKRQADEDTRQSRPGALSLDGPVDLINCKGDRFILHECGRDTARVSQKNQ
jgi:hypothetical protein